MRSIIIVYSLPVFLFVSGITRIKQTEPLSEPLTSFLMFEDKLYIGGANRIYVFNKDLRQIQTANTCESRSDACSENINKILLAHDSEQFHVLVSCGTGNSGLCEARNLSQIESVLWSSSQNSVDDNYLKVSTNKNRPAVGLITEQGEFIVALTFGEDIFHTKNRKNFATYKYAISARELSRFAYDFEKVIKLQILNIRIHEYLIYYKVCFQHNGMIYFATNQKSEVGSETYVSKLVRICFKSDYRYEVSRSYVDIVINCNRSNVTYNLIQEAIIVDSQQNTGKVFIGVFTRGDNPEQVSGDSVICITEMRNINDALTNAQWTYASSYNEYGPEGQRYLRAYIKGGVYDKYYQLPNDWIEIACNNLQQFSNVIGNDPINIEANVYTPKDSGFITTLAGARYENKTAIMFGTSKGIIIQTVLLENFTIIENYKMTVDLGNEVRKIYSVGEDIVYVMSNQRVLKYATTDCSEFQSCADMARIKHPLCGWCVFEGRATRRSACSQKPGHWISTFEKCLSISVWPDAIPLSTASTSSDTSIIIDIQDIPQNKLADTYYCRFFVHSNKYKTIAAYHFYRNIRISCLMPIVSVVGDVMIELLVTTQAGIKTSLSSASIRIYECRQYRRCMECINTVADHCIWCGQAASCQEKKAGCTEPWPISDVSRCPQLIDNKGIFIPAGTRKHISLNIANALNFSGVIYRCILPASESVIAILKDEFVSCTVQVMQNKYEKKRDFRVIIKYGPGIDRLAEIDDPFANSVTVYRCSGMGSDCSHCQALNKSRYPDCFWGDTDECINAGGSPLLHCPPPHITKVTPIDGSIYGGTLVTVFGRNLGRNLSDINTIKVANVTCDPIDDKPRNIDPDYETLVPLRLICKTRKSSQVATKGAVTVVVEGKLSNTNIEFSYKRPNVSHIHPNFGPKAGGTKITVYGKHLGIGNKNRVLFLGNYGCEQTTDVTEELSDAQDITFECVIKCRVSCTFNVTGLTFLMDGREVITDTKLWFSFVDNPVVDVERVSTSKAFVSGGTLFTIEGKSLNHSHSSSVKLHYMEESTIAKCDIKSAVEVGCRAPKAPNALKEELASQLSSTGMGKQRCDKSISVLLELNLDAVIRNFTMSYYNDPVFDNLPEDRNVLTLDSREPWIFLSGECFSTKHRDDIDIQVGNESCEIIETAMTETSIKCFLQKPRVIPWNKYLKISVTFGNINVTIGYLRYAKDKKEDDRTMLIVYVSVAALLICIVISGAFFTYRRFRKLKNRVAYLEVKKGGMRRGHSQNTGRQTVECNIADRQSGVYHEINDEDVLKNPVDVIGERIDDKVDGYLVPHTYTYIDQVIQLEDFSQSNREINPNENIDNDAVRQDVTLHLINDMTEDEIRHVQPVRISKAKINALERAKMVVDAKVGEYVVDENLDDKDDGSLVPPTYTIIDQKNPLDDFSQSNRNINPNENIDIDSVNQNAFMNPNNHVNEGETRHVQPGRISKVATDALKRANMVTDAKWRQYILDERLDDKDDGECNITDRQSGVYNEINNEDVLNNPVDVTGEKIDDKDDGYLVPLTYTIVDQINPVEDFSLHNIKINPNENIDNNAVNEDAYLYPINDVSEDETRNMQPAKISEVETYALERAEIVMNVDGVEYFVGEKLDNGDDYLVPHTYTIVDQINPLKNVTQSIRNINPKENIDNNTLNQDSYINNDLSEDETRRDQPVRVTSKENDALERAEMVMDAIGEEHVVGEKLDDRDDGYLIPHRYRIFDQINSLEDFTQRNRNINPVECNDDDTVSQDAYLHPINDVSEGETRHVQPVRVLKVETDPLEKEEMVTDAKVGEYVVGKKLDDNDDGYLVPYTYTGSKQGDEKLLH